MFSFHHWFLLLFSSVFIADCICSLHSLFLQVFLFYHWFYYCFLSVFISSTFFAVTVLYQVLRFCVVVSRVLRIWESFFYPQAFFTLQSFPTFGKPAFIKVPMGPAVLPWRLQGLPLNFETQTRPIYLFESHSIQQKVLVGTFYLCIKDLRNTLNTRFWTQSLIAICT